MNCLKCGKESARPFCDTCNGAETQNSIYALWPLDEEYLTVSVAQSAIASVQPVMHQNNDPDTEIKSDQQSTDAAVPPQTESLSDYILAPESEAAPENSFSESVFHQNAVNTVSNTDSLSQSINNAAAFQSDEKAPGIDVFAEDDFGREAERIYQQENYYDPEQSFFIQQNSGSGRYNIRRLIAILISVAIEAVLIILALSTGFVSLGSGLDVVPYFVIQGAAVVNCLVGRGLSGLSESPVPVYLMTAVSCLASLYTCIAGIFFENVQSSSSMLHNIFIKILYILFLLAVTGGVTTLCTKIAERYSRRN